MESHFRLLANLGNWHNFNYDTEDIREINWMTGQTIRTRKTIFRITNQQQKFLSIPEELKMSILLFRLPSHCRISSVVGMIFRWRVNILELHKLHQNQQNGQKFFFQTFNFKSTRIPLLHLRRSLFLPHIRYLIQNANICGPDLDMYVWPGTCRRENRTWSLSEL